MLLLCNFFSAQKPVNGYGATLDAIFPHPGYGDGFRSSNILLIVERAQTIIVGNDGFAILEYYARVADAHHSGCTVVALGVGWLIVARVFKLLNHFEAILQRWRDHCFVIQGLKIFKVLPGLAFIA